ncbi:MAG: hypothetical protein JWN40_5535 [Phycisphaerales bacterium]|nr:hypothetical protein [Phycisphaerales bacterium]
MEVSRTRLHRESVTTRLRCSTSRRAPPSNQKIKKSSPVPTRKTHIPQRVAQTWSQTRTSASDREDKLCASTTRPTALAPRPAGARQDLPNPAKARHHARRRKTKPTSFSVSLRLCVTSLPTVRSRAAAKPSHRSPPHLRGCLPIARPRRSPPPVPPRFPPPNPRKLFKNPLKTLTSPPPAPPRFRSQLPSESTLTSTPSHKAPITQHFSPSLAPLPTRHGARFGHRGGLPGRAIRGSDIPPCPLCPLWRSPLSQNTFPRASTLIARGGWPGSCHQT